MIFKNTLTRYFLIIKNFLGFIIITAIIIAAGFGFYVLFTRSFDFDKSAKIGDNNKLCNIAGISIDGGLASLGPKEINKENFITNLIEDSTLYQGGVVNTTDIRDKLYSLDKQSKYKAIVIDINSPGGNGGDEILEAVQYSEKPIISFVRTMAASAGYEAIMASDYIIGSPFSEVGSIGVTGSFLENSKKNQKEGFEYISLSSGKYKDSGNPDKKITEDEKIEMMKIINKMHNLFVESVSITRSLPMENVKKISDGRTFLAQDAKDLGLIDQVGSWSDTKNYLKELIGEDPVICWE